MNKKLMISAAAVLMVTVVGALFIGIISSGIEPNETSRASIAASAVVNSNQDQQEDTVKMVEKIGVISCLKPLDETNPQTSSCAIGLIQADGIAYALYSADPTLVGSLTSGQRMQIMGFIVHQVTGYKTAGVISIHDLRRL
ncbi:MAG: hypothetical protein AAB436_00250 [Patescibacteria group bacterium]